MSTKIVDHQTTIQTEVLELNLLGKCFKVILNVITKLQLQMRTNLVFSVKSLVSEPVLVAGLQC